MKATFRAAVFLLLCLFASPAAADDYTLDNLAQEAQEFAAAYAKGRSQPPQPEQAALLLHAAEIMTAAGNQEECAAALPLHKKAAFLAGPQDADFWLSLAKTAACAKEWLEASRSGWLAHLAAAGYMEADTLALRLTSTALDQRSSDYGNWLPAAISVQEMLAELGDKEAAAKIVQLRKQNGLKIQESLAEPGSEQPRLCLRFNDELNGTDAMHYGDYVEIAPAIAADFSVDESRLCIGGAAYGTTYKVTLRSGLQSKTKTLAEAVSVTIESGHSKPMLWFNQSDYLLANAVNPAIGLNTLNVSKVKLQLFRIHERNILGNFVREHFRGKLGHYQLDEIRESVGEQVWQGTTEINAEPDKSANSALVLPNEAVAAPGLYVLVAENDEQGGDSQWEDQASQWIVVTDIGLTTYQGLDGLTVAARSLATGLPIAGLEIGLYARNNTPLAALTTDDKGLVRFAPGLLKGKNGQAAFHLLSASKQHGFTFLQLEQTPFDLSDRGVGGRTAPGPLDAYVYTDRGIYRPGETVHVAALLRDQIGRAVASPPLTLRLNGPDGKVMLERLIQPDSAGGYADSVDLAASARSGDWTALLYVDVEDKAIGQTSFQVKSFRPPRLEVKLKPSGILSVQPEDKAEVAVQADYLYGSPGAALKVQARMNFEYEPHPFAEMPGFFFGRTDEKPDIADVELGEITTDEKGRGILVVNLEGQQDASVQPLKAVVTADVLDIDGRSVSASASLPVRHLKEYVGVKPGFSEQRLPANSAAVFEVIALDSKGRPQAKGQLAYRLIREETDWQWFRKNDEWGYEQITKDQEEKRGQLTWEKAGPLALSLPAGQGNYRLELLTADSSALRTSFRFIAGEQLLGKSDTPDSVKVALDRQGYKVGDTAKLTLTSPYPGQVGLVLANSTVNGVRNFALGSTEQTVEIPVEAGWGAGVYALVTVYRPGKEHPKGADRAVGLVWLPVDPADQRLEVTISSPDQARPRQSLNVPVAIKGAEAGSEVRLTLAAVDEGVLQLTNFVSPDPLAWFFGKQQLGLEIRDMYGQLIIPPESKPLILRTGADQDTLRGAPQSNVKIVSLFSGIVQAKPDGTVVVPLDIPDFNGRLRLMAVAWSKSKTGAASRNLRVNDPVVISPSLPRYLANDDRASISLLLENIDGPAGEYHIAWTAQGAVVMDAVRSKATAVLERGKRQALNFPVEAAGIGSGGLYLNVVGPEGYRYAGDFPLNVRGKYLPALTRVYAKLEPGASVALNKDSFSGLFPETVKVKLSVSSAPNVDVVGLLAELDRYPHGCLEQLTSRAMPLLYANQLAERFGYPVDSALAGRVQNAIDLILQKQRSEEGSFGLWSDLDDEEPWLSAYALDFLGRAREKGYAVPDSFYNKGMQWMTSTVKNSSNPREDDLSALAYAHWVLARAGQGRHEDARYLFDTWFAKMASPLAQAQLAGALALLGDQNRAATGMTTALRAADTEAAQTASWHSYGSRLRDFAGIISIIGDAGLKQADPALAWQEATNLLAKNKYLSTQEQAALIMAALHLDKKAPLDLDIAEAGAQNKPAAQAEDASFFGRLLSKLSGNKEAAKPAQPKQTDFFALSRSGAELLAKPVTVRNKGTAAVWTVTTVQGSPIAEPAPIEDGFAVSRSWRTAAGEPLSLDKVGQGDLAVVVLEGAAQSELQTQAVLLDLLPAGFEIEKAITDTETSFSWLESLSPFRYEDARDDRFVAAFDTTQLPQQTAGTRQVRPFRFAYLVRAVTPGVYAVPPPEVEAMYRPEYRARNKRGTVTISRQE